MTDNKSFEMIPLIFSVEIDPETGQSSILIEIIFKSSREDTVWHLTSISKQTQQQLCAARISDGWTSNQKKHDRLESSG